MEDDELESGVERETKVSTTEDGVLLTGSRLEMFERRILVAVRRPYFGISFLMLVMFVMLAGGAVLLNNLGTTIRHVDRTATNTDHVIAKVTGPQAQQQQQQAQAKVIDALVAQVVSKVDCQDQLNLQKLIDSLAEAGMTELSQIKSFVEPRCQTP